jgi:hypothetical protein
MIRINITQDDLEQLQAAMPIEGQEEVFEWSIPAEDPTGKVVVTTIIITVGQDERI